MSSESSRRSGDEKSLFRGASPEATETDTDMAADIVTPPLDDVRVTTSLPSDIAGNEENFTPIIDESVVSENLPSSHSKKDKGKATKEEDTNISPGSNDRILASLPVYFSTSLPSTSSLQIFQYPTYPRGKPLPVPESGKSRGLREAIRYRPKAKRVEVELPLDLRPAVYDQERGEDMAKGANVSGSIGQGPKEASNTSMRSIKVKQEYGEDSKSQIRGPKRLEKSRLDSTLIPNQTNYMIGVIRDTLHLTPVDSIIQMRPSMHYLDALDAMAQQEKRRAQAEPGEETDEGSMTEDGGKAKEKKKIAAQNLSVSVRDTQAVGPSGARGKGVVSDSRDVLMLADREAEGERWIDLDWKDEKTDESRKTFDAQLFASSKTPLECKTRPREYLK